MDFLTSMSISASGLYSQRARLDIASANLANAESTRTETGGAYRKKVPVLEAVPIPFDSILDQQMAGGMQLHGVKLSGMVESNDPMRREYRPDHPDAGSDGFVELPNVSVVEEMVNMIQASRSYEANVTAMNTAKGMLLRTFDLGSV